MSSVALRAFLVALEEVSQLGEASHPVLDANSPESLKLARAVGRGQIVLLSSHFERYIYAINEEIVIFLNNTRIDGDKLPAVARLLHSQLSIDEIGRTGWDHRLDGLTKFVAEESWL